MLKRSSGAMIVATGLGSAGVGTAAAKNGQGGSGLVHTQTWADHKDDRFQVLEALGTREFACRGPERTWRCYEIGFDDNETALLHVNPERRFDTVEDGYDNWHAFTPNALDCEACDRVKVSVKPATPRNGRETREGSGR